MKTGLITSDTYQDHDTGPGHPEQIARISVIVENFKKLNNKNILWKKPSIITDDIIKDAHNICEKLGLNFKYIFENSISCYNGTGCGKCGACTDRIKAFEKAGLVDVTIYEENNE